jgi:hypothetical protein
MDNPFRGIKDTTHDYYPKYDVHIF